MFLNQTKPEKEKNIILIRKIVIYLFNFIVKIFTINISLHLLATGKCLSLS